MQSSGLSSLLVGLVALATLSPIAAQEGFPLDGTWRGEWGSDPDDGNRVVIVMKWDGEAINGTINPGPNSFTFQSAELHPDDWTVHITALDPSGAAIAIEGTLMDIGSYNRRIVGTWTQGRTEYPFRISRQ